MHYVMSDIHGNMDKFQKMLRQIRLRPWDRLYILGDVIDRGPDGVEILKYIMRHKNFTLIKGNHEMYMCQAICQESSEITDEVLDIFAIWFDNGGKVTYEALLQEDKPEASRIVSFVDESKSYIRLTVRGKEYFLVHAGLFWNPEFDLDKILSLNERLGFLYEIRNGFLDRTVKMPFTVIAGHTPAKYLHEHVPDLTEEEKRRCSEHRMLLREDKIIIDCGCGGGHNLGCLRLEDMKEFYIS